MESPHDHFRRVFADTGDRIAAIRAIRERFGYDLRQAKEVMRQAEGNAASLAEHEEGIATALEQILERCMTESEWLQCAAPSPMLDAWGHRVSERKLRLLACASCRRIWSMLPDELSRLAIDTVERWAFGTATQQDVLRAATAAAMAIRDSRALNEAPQQAAVHAAALPGFAVNGIEFPDQATVREELYRAPCLCGIAVANVAYDEFNRLHQGAMDWGAVSRGADAAFGQAAASEEAAQAGFLRDIVGNPFRPAVLDPRWLTSNVLDLARAIYQECAFERMPILADALQDAGCEDADVVAHCRSLGPHVRGCWVVDLLLGKE
jgi:hypothetical protein